VLLVDMGSRRHRALAKRAAPVRKYRLSIFASIRPGEPVRCLPGWQREKGFTQRAQRKKGAKGLLCFFAVFVALRALREIEQGARIRPLANAT
jgi:hypothetical protein